MARDVSVEEEGVVVVVVVVEEGLLGVEGVVGDVIVVGVEEDEVAAPTLTLSCMPLEQWLDTPHIK